MIYRNDLESLEQKKKEKKNGLNQIDIKNLL